VNSRQNAKDLFVAVSGQRWRRWRRCFML